MATKKKQKHSELFSKANININDETGIISVDMQMSTEFYRTINTSAAVEDVGLSFLKEIERAINRKHLDLGQE